MSEEKEIKEESEEKEPKKGKINDGVAEITGDILANKSDVSEHVIEAERESENLNAQTPDEVPTTEIFDPAIHMVDGDGNPKYTKDGKLRLKPGRKNGYKVTSKIGARQVKNEPAADPIEEQSSAALQGAANVASQMFFTVCQMLGGEDFAPAPEEVAMMNQNMMVYLQSKDISDIPPGYLLLITMGAYAMPRFTRPKVKEKMRGLYNKVRDSALISKFLGRRVKNNAFRDIRHDGERKNNFSETVD